MIQKLKEEIKTLEAFIAETDKKIADNAFNSEYDVQYALGASSHAKIVLCKLKEIVGSVDDFKSIRSKGIECSETVLGEIDEKYVSGFVLGALWIKGDKYE